MNMSTAIFPKKILEAKGGNGHPFTKKMQYRHRYKGTIFFAMNRLAIMNLRSWK